MRSPLLPVRPPLSALRFLAPQAITAGHRHGARPRPTRTGSGRQHVYLHSSDSDTASFDTEAGPLFSAAAERLESGEPDVFSGGYTSPAGSRTGDHDILIWHAGQVDLVRALVRAVQAFQARDN
ncbi:hypothetical protein [Streptomyces cyaneofuscatus]|uniref:hypothetical protein n=1 Tax=Streptomyces cyaneofuscatus TaxID=66883 RepID=UPI0033A9AFBE